MACAVVPFAALVFSSTSEAAALTWPTSFQSATQVALQGEADEARLTSTACWSSNRCVSVGEDDESGAQLAIVVQDTNGVPGKAAAVRLPAVAQSGKSETAGLDDVSCSPSGTCVAVGEYVDTSGTMDALVVPITRGVVGAGLEVVPPGTSGESYLRSVSCPPTGACVAVGTYGVDSNAYQEGVVVAINSGAPGVATEVSPPPNANMSAPSVWVNAVSCWSAGSCVAAGQYQTVNSNGAIYPVIVPISGGVPAVGIEAQLPRDAYASGTGQQSVLASVSCESNGACAAVGSFVGTSGGSLPLSVFSIGGVPAAAADVSLPANSARGVSNAGLNAVGCAPSGPCSAVGYYTDSAGSGEPLVIPISGGGAATGLVAALPSNALATSTGYQDAALNAVSCPVSGACLAVGGYYDASDSGQGLVVPVSRGVPKAGSEAAPPIIEAATNPNASLGTEACAASGSCVAAGQYDDATAQTEAFEYSLQTRLMIASSRLTGTKMGAAYHATLRATGAWGSYRWSIASGRLPTGLRLNARTGVITGAARTAGSHSFKIQVAGTGEPAQKASRSLSIVVAAKPVVSLSISSGGLKLSGKEVSVKVRCSAAPCQGSLRLVHTHEVRLMRHGRKRESTMIGRVGYSLSAGRRRIVKIKLTAAGVRLLGAAKGRRLSVVVDSTVRGGKSTYKHTTVRSATAKKKKS